jgi:hypothetical protein
MQGHTRDEERLEERRGLAAEWHAALCGCTPTAAGRARWRVIDVEQITIDVRIPSDEVRIVAMQPFIRFRSVTEEPFRWSEGAVEGQLDAIRRTLDVALSGFEGRSANFTLFPEYAVPGVAGASAINDSVSGAAWPNESIIIAGVHGIAKAEYRGLCDLLAASFSQDNAPDSVPNDKWVNCCVIWVKDRGGIVRTWVQPKVRPNWAEMNVRCNDMFSGSTLYVFECQYESSGYPCRFATLVCFDWVARVGEASVRQEFLAKLNGSWLPTPRPLHWIFVVQHNPQPNHRTFLHSTYELLTDATTYSCVECDKAVVVHANTAASLCPARTGPGGFSGCVFSPSAQFDCEGCRPTVCMQPRSLRGSDILGRCKDVVFREMGECIHAFTVRVPRFVTPDPRDRALPLPLAHVYATYASTDPRLPGGPVPAAVKWINDSLDGVERLSADGLAGCPLEVSAEAIEPDIVAGMRESDGHAASDSVNWAACSFSHGSESRGESRRLNADLWGPHEASALEHVLHALTSLGLAYRLEFQDAVRHGAIQSDEGFVQVVAIRGDTYQDCREHFDKLVGKQGPDPVLVVVRDRSNLIPTPEEFSRLDGPTGERGVAFLDYQTLISRCRNAADGSTLKGHLNGFLPRSRRII